MHAPSRTRVVSSSNTVRRQRKGSREAALTTTTTTPTTTAYVYISDGEGRKKDSENSAAQYTNPRPPPLMYIYFCSSLPDKPLTSWRLVEFTCSALFFLSPWYTHKCFKSIAQQFSDFLFFPPSSTLYSYVYVYICSDILYSSIYKCILKTDKKCHKAVIIERKRK